MNQRNCPNCAAPYDIALDKCPYCGTSYYDLSALDLTRHEPFYLKIKTEMNGVPCYITQLVKPSVDMSIEFSSNTVAAYGELGNRLCSFTRSNTITTNISFEAVTTGNNKNLCTIEMEDHNDGSTL